VVGPGLILVIEADRDHSLHIERPHRHVLLNWVAFLLPIELPVVLQCAPGNGGWFVNLAEAGSFVVEIGSDSVDCQHGGSLLVLQGHTLDFELFVELDWLWVLSWLVHDQDWELNAKSLSYLKN